MGGISKILKKLADSVESGNYYEAHQIYHSVSNRQLNSGNILEACTLLHSGCLNLLKYQQTGSAVDLASRLLDVYNKQGLPVDVVNKQRLIDIFLELPLSSDLLEFAKKCILWSKNDCETGDEELHHVFGTRFYKLHEYYDAEMHLVYGNIDSAKLLGIMCLELDTEGEHGYFLSRSVLQLLIQKKVQHAKALLVVFLTQLKVADPSTFVESLGGIHVLKYRLANFSQFLVMICEQGDGTWFGKLQSEYSSDVGADGGYLGELLNLVGEVFFDMGVKKPSNPMQEMMKAIFSAPVSKKGAISSKPALSYADMD